MKFALAFVVGFAVVGSALAVGAPVVPASAPAPAAPLEFNYLQSGLDWGTISATCASGREQSPVNVVLQKLTPLPASEQPTTMTFGSAVNPRLYNTGETFQVVWDSLDGNNATISAGRLPGQSPTNTTRVPVNPAQFHFHTPAEHTIDGTYAAVEAHLVSRVPQSAVPSCPAAGCIVVFGVLYDISDNLTDSSPFLERILTSQLPLAPGLKNGKALNISGGRLNLDGFFPRDRSYLTYPGSLTTPPCSEGVTWHVMLHAVPISVAQMGDLQYALAETEGEGPCRVIAKAVTESRAVGTGAVAATSIGAAAPAQLCLENGQRANDRLPQPLNGRRLQYYDASSPTRPRVEVTFGDFDPSSGQTMRFSSSP